MLLLLVQRHEFAVYIEHFMNRSNKFLRLKCDLHWSGNSPTNISYSMQQSPLRMTQSFSFRFHWSFAPKLLVRNCSQPVRSHAVNNVIWELTSAQFLLYMKTNYMRYFMIKSENEQNLHTKSIVGRLLNADPFVLNRLFKNRIHLINWFEIHRWFEKVKKTRRGKAILQTD